MNPKISVQKLIHITMRLETRCTLSLDDSVNYYSGIEE